MFISAFKKHYYKKDLFCCACSLDGFAFQNDQQPGEGKVMKEKLTMR